MLEVKQLSKKYKNNDFYSLKDVSFQIGKGEIVGLIGKNGAGKTTLLKMLAKSYIPSEGSILYKGRDIFSENNMLSSFGLMIETVFYPHLTVMENLKFYLSIHNKKEYESNIQSVLELVELWNHRNKKPNGFSFGMKQRLSLAISLVTEPEFMILDEPFIGLDPDGVYQLMGILKKWSKEKETAIIISSHQLNELEEICNRYLFLEAGVLKEQFDGAEEAITVIELKEIVENANILMANYPEIRKISTDRRSIEIDSSNTSLNHLLSDLTKSYGVSKIYTKETKLNQYFKGGKAG